MRTLCGGRSNSKPFLGVRDAGCDAKSRGEGRKKQRPGYKQLVGEGSTLKGREHRPVEAWVTADRGGVRVSGMPRLGHRRPTCPPLILRAGPDGLRCSPTRCCSAAWGTARKLPCLRVGWAAWSVARELAGKGPGSGLQVPRGGAAVQRGAVLLPFLPFYALLVSVPERRMVFPLGCEGEMKGSQLALCAPPFCFWLLRPPRSLVLSSSPLKMLVLLG